MDLKFNTDLASKYKSGSQRIRIMSENWVEKNLFCPICGRSILNHYEANRPVADFFCDGCKSDFELKCKESKNGELGKKIVDGAYNKMISRITSMNNPNFFILTYIDACVNNFIIIPNHFFTPTIIEKRKPLSNECKRAGWIGCNININDIPESGKIFIVRNHQEVEKQKVIRSYQRTKSLETSNLESRGWILDVLNCIEKIRFDSFSLKQIYEFEPELKIKHPDNNFVKDKIRQQLQYLRDKGFIEFSNRGNYKKVKL